MNDYSRGYAAGLRDSARELSAAKAEAERLREALEAFMLCRTDSRSFPADFTFACLLGDKALAATCKEEGNG